MHNPQDRTTETTEKPKKNFPNSPDHKNPGYRTIHDPANAGANKGNLARGRHSNEGVSER
jgi:hypothetical protein